jgi:hypothetical protein
MKQQIQQAIQQTLPMFKDVLDLRKIAPLVLEPLLHCPIDSYLLPDTTTEQEYDARKENDILLSGQFIQPLPTDIPRVHINIHEGEKLAWQGADTSRVSLDLLDKHIAFHKQAEQSRQGQQPMMPQQGQSEQGQQSNPQTPSETPGQIGGDQLGAMGMGPQ